MYGEKYVAGFSIQGELQGGVGDSTYNIATFATGALGLATPLITTHEIDNFSEGSVVLARTKEYCSVFHGKIRIYLLDGIESICYILGRLNIVVNLIAQQEPGVAIGLGGGVKRLEMCARVEDSDSPL
ncbi:hypothetical protein VNO80_29057 [Phaseolus coccineus]|uniref:Uncharacterized protein n=1 Tax=Phaseolus coccineus TaxID=3886 RepID=A0AAN9LA80_PHACN